MLHAYTNRKKDKRVLHRINGKTTTEMPTLTQNM